MHSGHGRAEIEDAERIAADRGHGSSTLAARPPSWRTSSFPVVQSPVRVRPLTRLPGLPHSFRGVFVIMQFQSVDEILAATASLGRSRGRHFVPSAAPSTARSIDRLAHTGALGATPEIKGTARWVIRSAGGGAAASGPASIHDLYMAMGRGEAGGFTVPAMNIRDDDLLHGACGVPRGEGGSTPARSSSRSRARRSATPSSARTSTPPMITAAALREGFDGPLFIQGDHVQVNAKKYAQPGSREGARHAAGRSSARRSRPGSTTSTSTPRRSSISTRRRSTSSRP